MHFLLVATVRWSLVFHNKPMDHSIARQLIWGYRDDGGTKCHKGQSPQTKENSCYYGIVLDGRFGHDVYLRSWPREHRVDVAKRDYGTFGAESQIWILAHVEPFSSGFCASYLV